MKVNVAAASLLAAALLASCSAHKKVPYIEGAENIPAEILATPMATPEPIIQPGDLLNITVTGSDATAVAPFNKNRYVDSDGRLSNIGATSATSLNSNLSASTEYYLVDKDGNISFPILGTLHVEGLTKGEVEDMIANAIYPKYLKERPVVDIRFMNFRVTMLGAVKSPGIKTSQNERLNIFEAIALAGDLDIRGDRENIILVRTNPNGSREVHRLNIHDKNMLLSPYYNLQPNDMVIVNYNRSGAQNAWQMSNAFTTTLSVIGGLSAVTALVITLINVSK